MNDVVIFVGGLGVIAIAALLLYVAGVLAAWAFVAAFVIYIGAVAWAMFRILGGLR